MIVPPGRVRVVDAFVGNGAGGNPAGVLVCDKLPTREDMQAIAAETALPATAFVASEPKEGAHDVRWFSPSREIELCGHGALATAYVLCEPDGADIFCLRNRQAREVTVRRAGHSGLYELGMSQLELERRDWPELVAAMGAQPVELLWNDKGYACAIFETPEQVVDLNPNGQALGALGNIQISVSAPGAIRGFTSDITSRVFSGGGHEDSATGSAHALIAPYWCRRLDRNHFAAHQASPRGGALSCRVDAEMVWVGGLVREGAS